jgi:HD superfamily phosphohydrolase
MALNFIDILYGSISFPAGEEESFVRELISTPEVQRLRFLRLLNHDAPFMQEVATSRRFAHSIGTCFASFRLLQGAPSLSLQQRKQILAAALIHDIGVLPYGHLIERELARLDSSFSHEFLVRSILWGTYHPTNIYHQILHDASLKVAEVLRRSDVDPEEVFNLICPRPGVVSPIAGPIDLDNIDNIHRMAALMGRVGARKNVRCLLDLLTVDNNMHLAFEPRAIEHVRRWIKYRQMIYTHMIGHPSCVAYNAFLQDLARKAVELGVIHRDNWYLNDIDLESRLLTTPDVANLSGQLRTGCRYRLLDYVWVRLDPESSTLASPIGEEKLLAALGPPPVRRAEYRAWVERDRISRQVSLQLQGQTAPVTIGRSSTVVLIALIDPGVVANEDYRAFERSDRVHWRLVVEREARNVLSGRALTFCYPEDFPFYVGGERFGPRQLGLFQTAT